MSQTKVAVGMVDATGTPGSGNFLRGDGSWNAPGSGLTFISTTDISSAATYAFTAVDASSYDGYGFFLQNVVPVTDDVYLWLRTSTDGGSSYDSGASDYNWGVQVVGGTRVDLASGEIGITGNFSGATVGSAANESGVAGWVWVCGPHLAKYTMVSWEVAFFGADGQMNSFNGGGARLEAADVDACQFLFSSGNIETGTINAFGLANA